MCRNERCHSAAPGPACRARCTCSLASIMSESEYFVLIYDGALSVRSDTAAWCMESKQAASCENRNHPIRKTREHLPPWYECRVLLRLRFATATPIYKSLMKSIQQVSAWSGESDFNSRVRVKPEININFRLIEVLR